MSDNLTRYWKSLFLEAKRKSEMYNFVEADDICHRLLREPALPLLYRAGCNRLLAFGNDNPVGFAKEAVYWYQEMYDEVKDHPVDGPHHKLLLEQAQDALDNAEREAAEKAEQDVDEDQDEDEDNETQLLEEGNETEVDVEASQEEAAAELKGITKNVEVVPESDVERFGESFGPSSSMPTVEPGSSFTAGTASTLPTQMTQPTQTSDTAPTQVEKKKTSNDEEE